MDLTADQRAERARHAALRRHHPDDPAIATESLRRLRMISAEQYLRSLISTPPTLDLSQRRELAAILTGGRR